MPQAYLDELSKKYNKPVSELEPYWNEAKKAAGESYDEKDDKFWATTTEIFKNKVNKHMGLKEMNKYENILNEILEKKEVQNGKRI